MSGRLVRDKIPSKHPRPAEFRTTRDTEELVRYLHKKLLEEAGELMTATTPQEIAEEIADVFEVLQALAETRGVTEADVAGIAHLKRDLRGTFSGGVIWEASL